MDESSWCQKNVALTKEGSPVVAGSPHACKFCSAGAIQKASNNNAYIVIQCLEFLDKAALNLGYPKSSIDFNDDKTHKDVMRMFDLAINYAKSSSS